MKVKALRPFVLADGRSFGEGEQGNVHKHIAKELIKTGLAEEVKERAVQKPKFKEKRVQGINDAVSEQGIHKENSESQNAGEQH